MSERFDAVILGAGTAGETCAHRLRAAGLRVALVERELIGGECAYWACMPSKTLIRPATLLRQTAQVAGLHAPPVQWGDVAAYRDEVIQHLNDAAQVAELRDEGIAFLRGAARIAAPGTVTVGEHTLETEHIVVATGSEPRLPEIEGLREVGFWTNREATTLSTLPRSIVILGGSAQAIELGQMLGRFGVAVTVVNSSEHLLGREDPELGDLLAEQLRAEGITLHLGRTASRAERDTDGRKVITLDDGTRVRGHELLLATGRQPRVAGLGLESVGVKLGKKGIEVDEYCRAAPGIWAAGDVTGVALFTHVAQYQGRIIVDDILGHPHPADYTAVPRVVFSDPETAATGLTLAQAREQGIDIASVTLDLAETIARPETYGRDVHGTLCLHADRARGVLVGAWAFAPEAGEWISWAVLAIHARIPIATLRNTMAQFPTFSEAYLHAVDQLDV